MTYEYNPSTMKETVNKYKINNNIIKNQKSINKINFKIKKKKNNNIFNQ
jgi:hypothetical protein